jgi:hypothetical protein
MVSSLVGPVSALESLHVRNAVTLIGTAPKSSVCPSAINSLRCAPGVLREPPFDEPAGAPLAPPEPAWSTRGLFPHAPRHAMTKTIVERTCYILRRTDGSTTMVSMNARAVVTYPHTGPPLDGLAKGLQPEVNIGGGLATPRSAKVVSPPPCPRLPRGATVVATGIGSTTSGPARSRRDSPRSRASLEA